MPERVLCQCDLRVSVDGGGERTLVSISDGTTIRFWNDTAALERILQGETVQISAQGGYCRIEPHGDEIRLEFAADGYGRKRCAFPTVDFADALAWVRSLGDPLG